MSRNSLAEQPWCGDGGWPDADAMGDLVLSLAPWHEQEAIYVAVMRISAFVDESGIGGDDRIMLAGLVARSEGWFGFVPNWKKLLGEADIRYSHLVDMENGNSPFDGWNKMRTAAFVGGALPLVERYCEYGLTVALDLDLHRDHYRAQLSDKVHKDSAYGLCARAMIEGISVMALEFFGPDIRLNFIFEDTNHFGDALRIFNDCKGHMDNIKGVLGTITPGKKDEFGALQAADLVASLGRRVEETARFIPRDKEAILSKHGCPIFHVPLSEEQMPGYCAQAGEIASEKRWEAKKRKRARKGAAL